MKVCIVSSCGGHLTEVRCLKPVYQGHDYFYVLNDKAMLPVDMKGKTYFIAHSERDLKFFLNLWEAFQVLRRERPDVILSTGAGPVVAFAVIGRLLFRIRVIFVETITRIQRPSVTGRIMYYLAHDFFYQWESLRPFFPKATYGGPVV
jgi:beta-1,4-N-acetylglucosaminyltransferase